jgi:hypothetical protein
VLNPSGIRSICLDNSVPYMFSYNILYLISTQLPHRIVIISRKVSSLVYRDSFVVIIESEFPLRINSGLPLERTSELVLNTQRKCALILCKIL